MALPIGVDLLTVEEKGCFNNFLDEDITKILQLLSKRLPASAIANHLEAKYKKPTVISRLSRFRALMKEELEKHFNPNALWTDQDKTTLIGLCRGKQFVDWDHVGIHLNRDPYDCRCMMVGMIANTDLAPMTLDTFEPVETPVNKRKLYSPEEDALIHTMREQEMPYSVIGKRMGRDPTALRKHHANIIKAGKVTDTSASQPSGTQNTAEQPVDDAAESEEKASPLMHDEAYNTDDFENENFMPPLSRQPSHGSRAFESSENPHDQQPVVRSPEGGLSLEDRVRSLRDAEVVPDVFPSSSTTAPPLVPPSSPTDGSLPAQSPARFDVSSAFSQPQTSADVAETPVAELQSPEQISYSQQTFEGAMAESTIDPSLLIRDQPGAGVYDGEATPTLVPMPVTGNVSPLPSTGGIWGGSSPRNAHEAQALESVFGQNPFQLFDEVNWDDHSSSFFAMDPAIVEQDLAKKEDDEEEQEKQ